MSILSNDDRNFPFRPDITPPPARSVCPWAVKRSCRGFMVTRLILTAYTNKSGIVIERQYYDGIEYQTMAQAQEVAEYLNKKASQ